MHSLYTQTHKHIGSFTDLQIHQYVVLWTNATLSSSLRQFQNYIHMWMHNRVAVRKALKLKLKCVSVFLVSVLETCKDFDCRYCGDLKFLFYNICHTEKF